jgi:flagellar hook assembly protein FlgD
MVTDIWKDKILSQGSILVKPNPFTIKTSIEYKLTQSSNVQLSIYNHLGEKVMSLMDKYQTNGKHQFTFNGSGLPAGIYFCVLKTPQYTETKKIIKLN